MATSFAALGAAQEQRLVRAQTAEFLKARLEQLVAAGAVSVSRTQSTALQTVAGIPTKYTTQREWAYKHVKSAVPVPRPHTSTVDAWLLGSKVSLGRAKWEAPAVVGEAAAGTTATAAGAAAAPAPPRASIFSVADGRRLAQEPVRHLTAFEAARAARVADAALDARTLAGLQLLPRFTPGRAFLWGSILAAWGTAAAAVGAGRALGVTRLEELPEAVRGVMVPAVDALRARAEPAREALAPVFFGGPGDGTPGAAGAGAARLAARLKGRLASSSAGSVV